MRKIKFGNILTTISIFATLLIVPYVFDTLIDGICREYGYQIPFYFNLDRWFDIMAIAFPSALTYIVICQSESQQKDNTEMQKSLEHINAKMLNLEQKAKIGYFIPYVKLKDAGIDGFERSYYPHDLRKYITLSNMGNDDVFIIGADGIVNGKKYDIPLSDELFVPKSSPLKELLLDCTLSDEDLSVSNIDVVIKLTLRNMIGYEYIQILNIGFINHSGKGEVNSFNMSIREVSDYAD